MAITLNGSTGISSSTGSLAITGDIVATGEVYAGYSDARLKTITGNIENAVEKVMSLNGVTFVPNELATSLGCINTNEQVGLIAQDVEKVLPQVIRLSALDVDLDENDNIKSKSGQNYINVQYDKIVPLLVEAIKEQQKQIEELKRLVK